MVSFSGLLRTLQTTSNLWTILQLRNSKNSKTIRFRNGVEAELTYSQYTMLRDWFDQLHNQSFTIEKTDHAYIIKKNEFSYQAQPIVTAKPFFEFLQSLIARGWTIKRNLNKYNLKRKDKSYFLEQTGKDLFKVTSDTFSIVGPSPSMNVFFYECEEGLYENDYAGKTVLDIGGFCGETAVYFFSKGAKKIVIYEPVLANQELIQKNITLNNINAEIHGEGVGAKDAEQTISYDSIDLSFGLTNTGKNQTNVKLRSISNVLLESKADIAKIDCEGAEINLINTPPEILGHIDFYFIETHNLEIEKAVATKLSSSGFQTAREPVRITKDITMLYFKKSKEVK